MAPMFRTLRLLKAQAAAVLLMMSMLMAASINDARAQQASGNFVINDVQLTNFEIDGNVLRATGTVTGMLAGLPFTTDITNFALQLVPDDPTTQQVECSVLDLELGPINLALLGLHVDTSPICLEITAIEGGGLLGDLLCALAGGGLLGTGTPIIPTADQLSALEGELFKLLNGALGRNLSPAQGGNSVCVGECEILELALGALDLTLLGLNVLLDDCEGGPVQVCISASRGEGILGDLLCGLTGPQLGNLTLSEIVRLIDRAVDLAPGGFTRLEIAELRTLLLRLARS